MPKNSRQLLLLAHGSRQEQWAHPFELVRDLIQRQHPGLGVRLAFLEFMQPSLHEALNEAGHQGIEQVLIAPLFLGAGGHLQRDIPEIAQAVQAHHPALKIEIAPPAGDDAGVIEALAAYAARNIPNAGA
ncbi:MAG: CbiX/SirB N-terminal domain-containing protein [Thiomonas sp.]|nr:CbiX/SirB N-terminal domain-containing protein [Thiomonas sp.]